MERRGYWSKVPSIPPTDSPRETYSARVADRRVELGTAEATARRIAWLRLLVMAGLAWAFWLVIQGQIAIPVLFVPVAAFTALVAWQSRLTQGVERLKRAIRFHERGIARLDHKWRGQGSTGEAFADPHHPYTSDLDIFGRGSLFELLSGARTKGGEARLAAWLSSAAPVETLGERHAAINELRGNLHLREELAVVADDFGAATDPARLVTWAEASGTGFPAGLRVVALVLSLIAGGILVWLAGTAFLGVNARIAMMAIGFVEGGFALWLRPRILDVLFSVHEPARDLDLLARLLEVLEGQEFRSPLLARVRENLRVDGRPASHRIARLRRWMELLDSRDNVIVRTVGPVVLWGTQIGMALEHWRAENGRQVAKWLDAVAELEALSSLAGYAWENPADPFPDFADGAVFDGDSLGHPLIAPDRCVRNSVCIDAPLRLLVVSGSNMSGKSTLLRAVGVNTVLALAGAPVRARRLRISPVALGASIRSTDSLEEGHSRFMAEILRLKQILDLPAPSLFLLDELLAGTNSHDRSIGAEGLIRALIARGAIGIATTHDLSLARVADDLAPQAVNTHFEDRLEAGRLVFDYTMREGVVTRSNALDLMRSVGLDV